MLSGLLKPDKGNVIIDYKNQNSSIGVCPAAYCDLENLTCMEQLIYMGKMYGMKQGDVKKRSTELLESFGLIEKSKKLAKPFRRYAKEAEYCPCINSFT